MNRPEHITQIIEKNRSPNNSENTAALEAYIANLESNQPARPARIVAILQTIQTDYSADASASLDAYVTHLESKQEIALPDDSQILETNNKRSPLWALRRRIQLERLRRARLDKKRRLGNTS